MIGVRSSVIVRVWFGGLEGVFCFLGYETKERDEFEENREIVEVEYRFKEMLVYLLLHEYEENEHIGRIIARKIKSGA